MPKKSASKRKLIKSNKKTIPHMRYNVETFSPHSHNWTLFIVNYTETVDELWEKFKHFIPGTNHRLLSYGTIPSENRNSKGYSYFLARFNSVRSLSEVGLSRIYKGKKVEDPYLDRSDEAVTKHIKSVVDLLTPRS
jgi:hypothetical protein